MSLFKTEELWSTKCGQGETFTPGVMCVANFLTKNDSQNDQIVTGSLSGYLRLFMPERERNNAEDENNNNPFSLKSCDNLKIEYNTKMPIIQIAAGKFVNESVCSLAVLNPRRLTILFVEEDLSGFKLVEEFQLERNCYNFCWGRFGHVSEKDYICVQATDTTLAFYVNGHLSFTSYLSDCLVPGPIKYLSDDDSIVVVNDNRMLQAYKYKNLALLNADVLGKTQQKRATADWSLNIGERALAMDICKTREHGSLILVACRRSVLIINGHKGTIATKRLDCRCSLLLSYGIVENDLPRILLANGIGEMFVFENTKLKWKAQLAIPHTIDIAIGSFLDGLNGFIVALGEFGDLSVLYLGTNPSTTALSLPAVRMQTSDNLEAELISLQQKIKSITTGSSDGVISVQPRANQKQLLKLTVDHSTGCITSDNGYNISISMRSNHVQLKNILVRVSVCPPIAVQEKTFHYATLLPDKECMCCLSFYCAAAMVLCSLRAHIYVSYELEDDIAAVRVAQATFQLPLGIALKSSAPVKQAKFKVTIDTNEDVVSLAQLFSEFSSSKDPSFSEQADIAIGLRYINDGPLVTVLASANAKRYRIQSDHFEAIWFILNELTRRLKQRFASGSSQSSFRINYSDPMPIDAYFLVLDFHFDVRQSLQHFLTMLDERSRQFRSIERLLLTKMKDKTVVSLQNLDTLVENALHQLLQLADLVSEQQQHLRVVGNALCASTCTLALLMQLSSSTTTSIDAEILRQSIGAHGYRDFPDVGLEEIYDSTLVFLLRSTTGSTAAHKTSQLSLTALQMPDNIDRLKKHVALLFGNVQLAQLSTDDTAPSKKSTKKSKKPKSNKLEPVLDGNG